MTIPKNPKIYHITHIDNLSGIINNNALYSDEIIKEHNPTYNNVGMNHIKKFRLEEKLVTCNPNTTVGQYAAFYLCPRTVMLFIIYKRNNPDMSYMDGQEPILHLQFDMHKVIEWANASNLDWAFSDCNAANALANFYNNTDNLSEINWEAIQSNNFSNPDIKTGKQAEFLVHRHIPWGLVEKIGVINESYKNRVENILEEMLEKPIIEVEREWYF
ncbi:MAG: DUF4433 domain-containing protein [Proteobacteria bacterium]|nr:DUF4433 domain-containing protein [Pseudomonadota bacterium]